MQPALRVAQMLSFIADHSGGDGLGVGVGHRQVGVVSRKGKTLHNQALNHQAAR